MFVQLGYLVVAALAAGVKGEDACMFMPPSTCRLATTAINSQLGLNATRYTCTVPPSMAFMAAEAQVNMGMGTDPNMGWACDANRTAMGCVNVKVLHEMTMTDGNSMTHNMDVCMPASFAANATAAQTWFDAMSSYTSCMMDNSGMMMGGNSTTGENSTMSGGMGGGNMTGNGGMGGMGDMGKSGTVMVSTGPNDGGGDEMTTGLTMPSPDMSSGPCGMQVSDVLRVGCETEDGVSSGSADAITNYINQAAGICGAATTQTGCSAASQSVSALTAPNITTAVGSAAPPPSGTSGSSRMLRGLAISFLVAALAAAGVLV